MLGCGIGILMNAPGLPQFSNVISDAMKYYSAILDVPDGGRMDNFVTSCIGVTAVTFACNNHGVGLHIGGVRTSHGFNIAGHMAQSTGKPISIDPGQWPLNGGYDVLHGDTQATGTVAAGATVYLGPTGAGAAFNGWEPQAQFCAIIGFTASSSVAPGGGQTYTYVPFNGYATYPVLTQIGGGASFTTGWVGTFFPAIGFTINNLALVTSAGAAVGNHRYALARKCY